MLSLGCTIHLSLLAVAGKLPGAGLVALGVFDVFQDPLLDWRSKLLDERRKEFIV
jgi:hypothetical protein